MIFTVLSLFPEILKGYFDASIMAKAVQRGAVTVDLIDIRSFADDRHKTCDDAPYGGGAGMVLKPAPLSAALDSIDAKNKVTLYPSPVGLPFHQDWAKDLAKEEELVFICGRYEGIDQRIIDEYVDWEISLGDYVLSSGEVASMVMIDTIYRLGDGIINKESLEEESFHGDLLEYPHYTRPEEFHGRQVPEVLLSGHHENIEKWRWEKRMEKTKKNRPDLYKRFITKHDNNQGG